MMNPEERIRLRGGARTSVGQVRSHNEDNIHLWTHKQYLLAIVADGMGGAAAGEEASRIAIETIQHTLRVDDGQTDAGTIADSFLRSAVRAANLSIINEAVANPNHRGMGTTVTMVLVKGRSAILAHVGDSRAYQVDPEGHIEQITADHSFVQALLDAGHITEEQAETHPMGNVLYRALGQTEDLDVDTYEVDLAFGDRMVLCSDGLTRHVRAPEIAKVVTSIEDPELASQKLVDMANERGGEDNISVIVVRVDRDENLPPHLKHAKDVFLHDGNEDETLILRFQDDDDDDTIPTYPKDNPAPSSEKMHDPLSHHQSAPLSRQKPVVSESDGEGRDRSRPDQ